MNPNKLFGVSPEIIEKYKEVTRNRKKTKASIVDQVITFPVSNGYVFEIYFNETEFILHEVHSPCVAVFTIAEHKTNLKVFGALDVDQEHNLLPNRVQYLCRDFVFRGDLKILEDVAEEVEDHRTLLITVFKIFQNESKLF